MSHYDSWSGLLVTPITRAGVDYVTLACDLCHGEALVGASSLLLAKKALQAHMEKSHLGNAYPDGITKKKLKKSFRWDFLSAKKSGKRRAKKK